MNECEKHHLPLVEARPLETGEDDELPLICPECIIEGESARPKMESFDSLFKRTLAQQAPLTKAEFEMPYLNRPVSDLDEELPTGEELLHMERDEDRIAREAQGRALDEVDESYLAHRRTLEDGIDWKTRALAAEAQLENIISGILIEPEDIIKEGLLSGEAEPWNTTKVETEPKLGFTFTLSSLQAVPGKIITATGTGTNLDPKETAYYDWKVLPSGKVMGTSSSAVVDTLDMPPGEYILEGGLTQLDRRVAFFMRFELSSPSTQVDLKEKPASLLSSLTKRVVTKKNNAKPSRQQRSNRSTKSASR